MKESPQRIRWSANPEGVDANGRRFTFQGHVTYSLCVHFHGDERITVVSEKFLKAAKEVKE